MSRPQLAEQFEDLDKQTDAARLGMWVFLGSEILLFAALFGLYAAYRTMYAETFAVAAAHDNIAIGTINTYILITSSLTVALALHAVRADRLRRAAGLLVFSMACGVAFLFLKGYEYSLHFHEGIFPGRAYTNTDLPYYGAKMFFNLYYLTTGLHAIHVTIGLLVLGYLTRGCLIGRYSAANQTEVELGGLYWHLVDIIWIFLWPLLYLTRQ